MSDRRSINRSMFWRVLRRSVFANRGRLFVILLALGAGAAITAALLNLQIDAQRRITSEFRAFGSNIVVIPPGSPITDEKSLTLREQEVGDALRGVADPPILSAPFLYFATDMQKGGDAGVPERRRRIRVIGAGTDLGAPLRMLIPGWTVSELVEHGDREGFCFLGVKVAQQLQAHERDYVELVSDGRAARLRVFQIISVGSDADDQIFVDLKTAQILTKLDGQASLVEINYPGTPAEIERFRSRLAARLPNLEVRPIRQFTAGEAQLYNKISGILAATIAVVLVLTALCVMAAMTNVAMERKNDVGLMKAIGGSVRRVLRLFLAEAALQGLAGGLMGAAVGMVISIGLGKAVFGVAAQPRFIVYPISVALTVIVAILAAYPLRRLVHIRPASVFRGEQ
jgi:putative ABC transport system permease protein